MPLEVVSFDMGKIPIDTRDQSCTDRIEIDLGDQYSLMVYSSYGILVLPICLHDDCELSMVGWQVRGRNSDPSSSFRV